MLGDTAYGIGPVRAELADRGVDVLAPLPPGSSREGRLPKRDFAIDLDARHVTCPTGAVAPISQAASGTRTATFRRADCAPCALHDRCAEPSRGIRKINLAPDEELLIAARKALDDPANADRLRRRRPRIERLLSLLSHRYGARKCRYHGTHKAEFQAAWTAALVNLNPIGRKLASAVHG